MAESAELSRDATRARWILAIALWVAFASLAAATHARWTMRIDSLALQAARSLRAEHPSLIGALRDLSGFGSTLVLFLLTAATAGWLVLRGSLRDAVVVGAASLIGFGADNLAKHVVARARPPVADAAFAVSTYSYPSGHAAFSALVFLMLALVFSTGRSAVDRRYAVAVAIVFSGLVGASRVLLGVHWASDVVGGWLLGAGGALIAGTLLRPAR
ncbi:MAG TPA: phosphatase PAP2 family protein [Caldimonas sp.]|nr:phosphatase PAP2 family protein [Caldimonas sp.]